MPRPPRSVLSPVGVYHVTSRGVARQEIVRDDHDRRAFRRQLNAARLRHRWLVYAWCLMTNHYHLVVVCDLERLSRGLHLLNFHHAQTFNARHDRVGHLFQGRFDARVIEGDEHLAAVCGYVLDNPVRAGLCDGSTDWPWLGGEMLADLQ
ncbi:MAG TPA: transposase [Gaiellaceae bacterium]|jgi:REP element-mobilizing transposase RayT|nr:transposase [Gaiellaceae bacterium]